MTAIETHREWIMRDTLCIKMVDNIDDGHEWFAKVVTIGGEKLTIYIRKATPDECGQ